MAGFYKIWIPGFLGNNKAPLWGNPGSDYEYLEKLNKKKSLKA
jgi:hypothetical protein